MHYDLGSGGRNGPSIELANSITSHKGHCTMLSLLQLLCVCNALAC